MQIAVLVTCHNRVEVTLRGLRSLVDALDKASDVQYDLFVVDDGSKDGTASEVARQFPKAHVAVGNGRLFWNGGMCRAYSLACRRGGFSEYLLFNDDVVVCPEALAPFLSEYRSLNSKSEAILAAATLNDDGAISYSAYLRTSKFRPLKLHKLKMAGGVQSCHTFNGNFVMVPARFFDGVGGLDERFVHAYGDIDLGYRALRAGVQPYLASKPIGVCKANDAKVWPRNRFLQAIRGSWGKGDSLGQRVLFLRKHSPLWVQAITVPATFIRYGFDRLMRRIDVA